MKYFQIEDEDTILARGEIVLETTSGKNMTQNERSFLVENNFTFPPGKRTRDFFMYGKKGLGKKKELIGTIVGTRSYGHERRIVVGPASPQMVLTGLDGREHYRSRRRFKK